MITFFLRSLSLSSSHVQTSCLVLFASRVSEPVQMDFCHRATGYKSAGISGPLAGILPWWQNMRENNNNNNNNNTILLCLQSKQLSFRPTTTHFCTVDTTRLMPTVLALQIPLGPPRSSFAVLFIIILSSHPLLSFLVSVSVFQRVVTPVHFPSSWPSLWAGVLFLSDLWENERARSACS